MSVARTVVLGGEAVLPGNAPESARAPSSSVVGVKERRREDRLVGRDSELGQVLSLAAEPTMGAVLVSGPTGIGTSALAESAMVALVEGGWQGFGLTATGSATHLPYSAISELVPDALDGLDDINSEHGHVQILRALEDALGLNDRAQVVVVADEIASVDARSAELLVHLAANRRLFVIATEGTDHLDSALRLLTPAGVTEIELGPLDVTDTATMIGDVLGGRPGPGLVRNLHRRTMGYPFFVRELALSSAGSGSIETVADVLQLSGDLALTPALGRQILHRLGVGSDAERAVIELLAIAGDLSVDQLTAASGGVALESLERRGLVRIRTDRRRLRAALAHPLHAEAVATDLTSLGRRNRSRELADLIEAGPLRRSEDLVLLRVAQLAGGIPVDTDALLESTYAALRLDRIRDAGRLGAHAHASDPTEETLAAHAETLIRRGRFVEAERLYQSAMPPEADDWTVLRRAIRRSSNHLWGFGDAESAMDIDVACLTGLSDTDAVDRVVAHQAWVDYCAGRSRAALDRTDHLTDTDHPDVRFATSAVRAPALVMAGRVGEGAELAQTAWENGWGADTEFGSHNQHLIALGFARLYEGDLVGARFIADAAVETCRELSENTPLLFFLELAAHTELLAGNLLEALSHLIEALELGTELAIASSVLTSLAGAAAVRAQLGRADDAAATWQRTFDVPPAPGPRGGGDLATAQAWVSATSGDPAHGAETLRSAAADAAASGRTTWELLLLWDVARLGYAMAEDADRAAKAAVECQGELLPLLAAAVGACAANDPSALDAVAASLAARGFALWSAELSARASDAWAGAGDQRAATAAQRRSDELRPPDARTPSLARARTTEPLSRREREVAALAAAGAANAQIAEQLHLSVRTVETHLQKVYRKLGVSSRKDLADAIG